MQGMNKWQAIASGLYLEFLAGIIYAFPVYSDQLKVVLNTDQTGTMSVMLHFPFCRSTSGGGISFYLPQLYPIYYGPVHITFAS